MPPAKLQRLLEEALAEHRAGRLPAAEKKYAQVRGAAPGSFDAFHLSGFLALQEKRLADALGLLQRARRLNPRSALCALRLAHALKTLGRLPEAREAAGEAAALDPMLADAHFCLGELTAALQGFAAAVPHLRRVTELQPEAVDGWANLGVALAQSNDTAGALACFGRALAVDPANSQALTGRALALQAEHRTAEALADYARVLAKDPARHEARSARLLALHYSDEIGREELFREHLAFGAAVELPPEPRWTNAPEPGRRLRVALLSPDLRAHPIAYFLEPLLAHLDRSAFEIFLYHDHAIVDATSLRLRAQADQWRNFAGLPAGRVETAVRADAPDILVDLAGHTGFNRLPLFARRLAPVQVTYLGYPDTTGLRAMDYRLVDAITDPAGEADALATEELIRFAPAGWAYAPPADAPAVVPPPAAKGGPVTFGCFNNFAKVSDATLRGWAEVLAAVPDSRLLLKDRSLTTPGQQERVRARFAELGVEGGRIELLGRTSGLAAHLAHYARMDIALDAFPYHGTTTTCEALWMGRPVVTLCGDRHASRVGASLLTSIGHPEWIAEDWTDYTRIAAGLAADLPALAKISGGLRSDMEGSPLLDHPRQAARFGAALREGWARWCAESAPVPVAFESVPAG
ncbi:MAG TPA: tetratricopeptide repeat protein [Opitutus sp.]|nr:tetratricopeptide repeat protein [Opitutus sp.]